MNILGLSGSLRRDSRSTALLRAASELLPDGHSLTLHSLSDLPFFNGDLEDDVPASVRALGQAIRDADALLLASPEYNHSIPAVLKNALDWASRKSSGAELRGKPVAVISQSPGPAGGARMQMHLREVLSTLGLRRSPGEFAAGSSNQRFEGSELVDPDTRERLRGHLASLITLTEETAP